MTIQQIFDKIKYGEEYMNRKALEESLKEDYDSDYGLFYASKRIRKLTEGIDFNEKEDRVISRIINSIEIVEGKVEDGKVMSESYQNQKSSSIASDINFLLEETENISKKSMMSNDKKKAIAQIASTAEYFTKNYISDKMIVKEASNPLVSSFLKEDMDSLEDIL